MYPHPLHLFPAIAPDAQLHDSIPDPKWKTLAAECRSLWAGRAETQTFVRAKQTEINAIAQVGEDTPAKFKEIAAPLLLEVSQRAQREQLAAKQRLRDNLIILREKRQNILAEFKKPNVLLKAAMLSDAAQLLPRAWNIISSASGAYIGPRGPIVHILCETSRREFFRILIDIAENTVFLHVTPASFGWRYPISTDGGLVLRQIHQALRIVAAHVASQNSATLVGGAPTAADAVRRYHAMYQQKDWAATIEALRTYNPFDQNPVLPIPMHDTAIPF